jgi:hypothetical protein
MNLFTLMSQPAIYCEFSLDMFHVWHEQSGFDVSLERQDDGKLTQSCCQHLAAKLNGLTRINSGRPRILCAINGRGVSLRKLRLPPVKNTETESLLKMQIESEFPLPPDELAWGFQPVPQINGSNSIDGNEYCVAAVKKEVVEQYATLLRDAGYEPEFTLSALARRALCQHADSSCAIVDIGHKHSELIVFDHGVPMLLRILPWGENDLVQKLCARLHMNLEDGVKIVSQLDQEWNNNSAQTREIHQIIKQELRCLSELLMRAANEQQWYLSGAIAKSRVFVNNLSLAFPEGSVCQALLVPQGKGYSAAVCGLMKKEVLPPLILATHSVVEAPVASKPGLRQWIVLAVFLAVAALSMRHLEPLLFKPVLVGKLQKIQEQRKKLPQIDRELNFLQFLKTNQPPYLEALNQIANAAPQGTLIDTISMNRRGELTLRGSFREPPQALLFRSNLVSSGFFSTVVAADLSPSPDRQKWTVRLNAQWNTTKSIGPLKGATNETPSMSDKENRAINLGSNPPKGGIIQQHSPNK